MNPRGRCDDGSGFVEALPVLVEAEDHARALGLSLRDLSRAAFGAPARFSALRRMAHKGHYKHMQISTANKLRACVELPLLEVA